jgi:hypothetical protein
MASQGIHNSLQCTLKNPESKKQLISDCLFDDGTLAMIGLACLPRAASEGGLRNSLDLACNSPLRTSIN